MGHIMKKFLRVTIPLIALVGALLVAGSAGAATSCHAINAKGVGQDQGGGVTTAAIRGGGLLQGTTEALFILGAPDGTVFPFTGDIVFTTNRATLTVTLVGAFDVSTGQFNGSGPVTAATGKLAGASGNLSFAGVEDFSTGRFTETVVGEICVDLAP